MASHLGTAPILSTPDDRLLEVTEPVGSKNRPNVISEEELSILYDIERTLVEIRRGRWKRIALQFPDDMLPDAPRVFQLLSRGLQQKDFTCPTAIEQKTGNLQNTTTEIVESSKDTTSYLPLKDPTTNGNAIEPEKLFILGDTSYGSCCVDEIAAEHANADVVVHYGRACLSPTARLPVIHIFTHKPLPLEPLVRIFHETYPDLSTKIVVTADVTYSDHVQAVYDRLTEEGYNHLFASSVLHDPSSLIPNRTIPEDAKLSPEILTEWQLFHISDPPESLLLTLASRVGAIHIYPTERVEKDGDAVVKNLAVSTAATLRRRYAMLTSLSTAPIFGILINTLSVKNYLHIVDHVKELIAAAGKKSYTFVVGKLNAAKVANFSEIGGWVVIGCWESSLIDGREFWKPVITPFELELALQGDANRLWTGAWRSDFQDMLEGAVKKTHNGSRNDMGEPEIGVGDPSEVPSDWSEPESAPPEFDLRTGRYVSHTRPMRDVYGVSRRSRVEGDGVSTLTTSTVMTRRPKGDLVTIGGAVSPGADFLQSQRTWKGLGSDFEVKYEDNAEDSAVIKEGRKGIARGYTQGGSEEKH